MAEIIKIALLGIAGVLFAIQFRQQRPEYALLIGFALSILVFSFVWREICWKSFGDCSNISEILRDTLGF